MTNSQLSPEQLKTYKKIFVRHIKQHGVYSAVKRHLMHRNITFDYYILVVKKQADAIMGLVETIWSIVNHSISNSFPMTSIANVKASIVMLSFITDNDFINIFNDTVDAKRKVDMVVKNEFAFMFGSGNDNNKVWLQKEVSPEDADKTHEILSNYAECVLYKPDLNLYFGYVEKCLKNHDKQ